MFMSGYRMVARCQPRRRMLVVGISDPRPIRLGCFDVRQDVVVIVDQSLPIAVEVDGVSGQVTQVSSWPLSPDLRSRPTALDALISGESLMIASPAAGGVVVIDRRSGQASVIPLEADVGALARAGDYVILGPPTPVWQIRGGAARRINADLECLRLTAVGGMIVGACKLPGDPLIRHVGPRGPECSHRSPGTIIVLDDAGTAHAVGPVASTDGVICEDRGRIWLLGFDQQLGELEGPGPRELFLAEGRIAGCLDMRLHHPVGVVDGLVADLARQPLASDPYGLDCSWDQMAVRFLPVDGGDPSQVPLPGLDLRARAKVAEGQVWVWQGSDAALTVVTPGTLSVRELRVELDSRIVTPVRSQSVNRASRRSATSNRAPRNCSLPPSPA